jgi:hypothetical protein
MAILPECFEFFKAPFLRPVGDERLIGPAVKDSLFVDWQ